MDGKGWEHELGAVQIWECWGAGKVRYRIAFSTVFVRGDLLLMTYVQYAHTRFARRAKRMYGLSVVTGGCIDWRRF